MNATPGSSSDLPEISTAREVAAFFGCQTRKVSALAHEAGVGAQLGGRAGWRFTRSDVDAMWEVMRPKPQPALRRRRRLR
ncbi:helix-turn-helix domain-containing protein [Nocardioides bruguierae]|uniref:Helix-turn-helix domain-containing protein n=1 Tax=Nocardioides bruguierae TaxID=2945102 RepID=A0A9X2ID03_9ACTN|nr:helix-turn-helix domain-containing protein [Nocardioides bruguierae]MCM0618757.1 helix-turn-helix domain-containing protein [Nocardioides bruguierae]